MLDQLEIALDAKRRVLVDRMERRKEDSVAQLDRHQNRPSKSDSDAPLMARGSVPSRGRELNRFPSCSLVQSTLQNKVYDVIWSRAVGEMP
jgi:hypothetical protein